MLIAKKSTYLSDQMHLKNLQAKICREIDNRAPKVGSTLIKNILLWVYFVTCKFVLFSSTCDKEVFDTLEGQNYFLIYILAN
jgi:hypothetical protein